MCIKSPCLSKSTEIVSSLRIWGPGVSLLKIFWVHPGQAGLRAMSSGGDGECMGRTIIFWEAFQGERDETVEREREEVRI